MSSLKITTSNVKILEDIMKSYEDLGLIPKMCVTRDSFEIVDKNFCLIFTKEKKGEKK